jgi:hypothetical protein
MNFMRASSVWIAVVFLAVAAPRAMAASPVPIEKLSTSQRVSTAPDSMVVKVSSNLTTTLGKLRAAHRSYEQGRIDANPKGAAAGKSLKAKPLRILRVSTAAAKTTIHGKTAEIGGHVGPVVGPSLAPAPYPILRVGGYIDPRQLWNLATTVVERPSSYASTPADMRAFCAAAQASACAYLPPNVYLVPSGANLVDEDPYIPGAQCTQEGGTYDGNLCYFAYPYQVVVNFNPGNYQVASSASCNPPWQYQIDVHGAIIISLAGNMIPHSTAANPTCIVRVTVGP